MHFIRKIGGLILHFKMLDRKYSFALIGFFLAFSAFPQIANAAFLDFSPKTVNSSTGKTFDVIVKIDAGVDQILSTDARIIFDPKLLTVTEVLDGDYFSIAKKDCNSQPGKCYIAGIVETPGDFKTGKGDLATITFKALASGTGTISYVCNPGETARDSNIAKNVLNVTDIIECPKNGKVDIIVGGAASGVTPGGERGSDSPGFPDSSGSGSSTTTRGGTSSTSSPSALPRSGSIDTIMQIALPAGTLLFFIGLGLKLFL